MRWKSGKGDRGSILLDGMIAILILAIVLTQAFSLFGKVIREQKFYHQEAEKLLERENTLW